MLSKVKAGLANALTPGEPCLIGVSGGADSVALLHALTELGHQPHVCHLNHSLRGKSSDGDTNFVRDLARHYRLPCEIKSEDVAAYAKKGRLSLEDAARQVRYSFFSSVSKQTGIQKLLLAHTSDDQAETVLFRLLRGAGPTGLTGISPQRQLGALHVIRPLIQVSRNEILDYLEEHNLSYREDSSNADTRFTRNRIRLELLPLLEREFNPSVRTVLLQTATILGDEDRYLEEIVRHEFYPKVILDNSIQIPEFLKSPVPIQRRLLRRWLSRHPEMALNLSFQHIEAVRVLANRSSVHAELHLPFGLIVYREYELLKKKVDQFKEPPHDSQWPIQVDGETIIQELDLRLHSKMLTSIPRFQNNRHIECFDLDKLGTKLFVRTRQRADRIQLLGMTQEKKLHDLFIDEKIPVRTRSSVPILCKADGSIIWVIGLRIADQFKVTKSTKNVLQIQAESVRG